MNRIITHLLSYFVLLLTFTSCQKGIDEPASEMCVISKVIFKENTLTTGISTFAYDNQYRILKEIIFEADGLDTIYVTSVKYETNKITVIEGEAGSTSNDTTIYSLTGGKVTSGVTRNPRVPFVENHTFQYSADGYISRTTRTTIYTDVPDTIVTTKNYMYKDGNVISETSVTGNDTYVETYQYLTDKSKLLLGAPDSYQALTEPNAKNLLSKRSHSGPLGTDTEEYAFNFDAKGKVTSYTLTANSRYFETGNLEYTCK